MKIALYLALFVSGTALAILSGEDAPQDAQAETQSSAKPDAQADAPAEAKADTKADTKAEARSGERGPAAAENIEDESFEHDASTKASLPSSNAVDEIRKQREQVEAKQKELAAKELELSARERALDEELKKLKATRDEISVIDDSRRHQNEEKVAKIVETLESMSPKASSQLLGTIDESLAVSALSRMSTAKLAKVMNVMEPAKSSRLTELMAGVVRSRATASVSADAVPQSVKKGGEKQHAKQTIQQ